MRNWILGGFLACFTTAGIAYVLAKNASDSHCGPCIEPTNKLKDKIPGDTPMMSEEPSEGCEHCKRRTDTSPKVVDVVDLDRTFLLADGTRPPVSFEEPPLAKPRGEITPAAFFTPALAPEVAPMPQETTAKPEFIPSIAELYKRLKWTSESSEVAPMPREVK